MPDTTTWELEPHTKAKHELLRGYLGAWLPIMARGRLKPKRVIVLDGFAGPGVYDNGEEGSPLIALRTVLGHAHAHLLKGTTFSFVFLEPDEARYASLVEQLAEFQAAHQPWPSNIVLTHRQMTFEEGGEWILAGLGKRALAPIFAFIDPFGVSGLPLDLIRRMSQFDKAEVFINFMMNTTQRFATAGNIDHHLVELFGTDEFTQANDHEDRRTFLRNLYQRQLQEQCGFKYVLSFEMVNRSGQSYDLFYGTKNLVGLEKMKGVMWRVDPTGAFSFSDRRVGVMSLFAGADARDPLVKRALVERFAGQDSVDVADVNRFILVDTAFAATHWKKPLAALEREGVVECLTTRRSRAISYADGTVVRFL